MKEKKEYQITEVSPELIKINPENVRDESEEEIESDENFQRLKDSIHDYGVLVPLIVKPLRKDTEQYILIDGERRLRAALATNLKTVPVHIITESDAGQMMLYAFQIHMMRKEWSKTAQVRAISKIIKKTGEIIGKKKEKELFDIIQEKTGYSDTKLKDIFRVLRYTADDDTILDEIDDAKSNLKFSHIVQIEASFIEQIEKIYPELIREYGIKEIRAKLLGKVRANIIGSTREPIDKLLPLFIHAKSAPQLDYLKNLIKEFIDKKNKTPDDIFRNYELKFPIAKEDLIKLVEEANKKIEDLESIMNNIKYTQFSIYQKLKVNLIKKIDSLIKILKETKRKIK